MKLHIRSAMLTFAALSTLFAGVPADADPTANVPAHVALLPTAAPADEYFGPLGLSVLGIKNSIAETTLRLDRVGLDDADTTKNVMLVEASVRAWEAKYPADAWLPTMVYALHRAYRKIATNDSLQRSVDTAAWLMSKYPKSNEAGKLRGELVDALAATDDDQPLAAPDADARPAAAAATAAVAPAAPAAADPSPPLPPYAQRP